MSRAWSVPRWAIVLLALGLIGCRAEGAPDPAAPTTAPSPTSSEPGGPAPSPAPTLVAGNTATSPRTTPTSTEVLAPTAEPSQQRVEGGALGTIWTLADVRLAEHADRFRLVLEMEETGTTVPFYTAELTDEASKPFPGSRHPDWGEVRIDLVVSDLYAYDYPLGSELPIEIEDHAVVTAVSQLPTYDDALLGFSIWLRAPAPFTVHELREPVRIALDVFYPE